MIPTKENRCTQANTCPGAILSIPSHLGLNMGFRDNRRVTSCSTYGLAQLVWVEKHTKVFRGLQIIKKQKRFACHNISGVFTLSSPQGLNVTSVTF